MKKIIILFFLCYYTRIFFALDIIIPASLIGERCSRITKNLESINNNIDFEKHIYVIRNRCKCQINNELKNSTTLYIYDLPTKEKKMIEKYSSISKVYVSHLFAMKWATLLLKNKSISKSQIENGVIIMEEDVFIISNGFEILQKTIKSISLQKKENKKNFLLSIITFYKDINKKNEGFQNDKVYELNYLFGIQIVYYPRNTLLAIYECVRNNFTSQITDTNKAVDVVIGKCCKKNNIKILTVRNEKDIALHDKVESTIWYPKNNICEL